MNNELVFLKPNVVVEPLIDSWYAWPHLISPATAALNIVKRHLDIFESYLANPEAHAQAVLNPKMLGGPFMDFGGGKLEEVKALMDKTLEERADMIELAKAIKALNNMLQTNAKGSSLETLYEQVPEILKGYVELYYDLNNNASYRFFESLLYKSKYNRTASQSIALWITNNDHRPFCLSTPRLEDDNVLRLNIPFSHKGIDELAKMKRQPQTISYIKEALGITPEQAPLFETFFTSEVPATYNKYTGDKIRMRYFGHACILVETKDVSILLDPLISYYGYHSDVEHFSDVDLPDTIDYAIITHNHQDHILFETLLPLRHKIKNLIVPRTRGGRIEDPELKLMLTNIGFNNVIELDELETIRFADTVITGVPFTGEHCDLNIQSKLCYHVQVDRFGLLFMADSRIMEPALYRHVAEAIGKVDVIFLGMECDGAPLSWLYGPLMVKKLSREQDNSRRLAGSDCGKGMSLVNIFHPKEIYVYAMGQEPWLEFISSLKYTDESNPIIQSNRLVEECTSRGMVAERLFGEKEILYKRDGVHETTAVAF
ncbi:MBL fold metallo-hydrolase [Chitinophaga varians]|uniref:MBL fold metallo-hydrolase n=1 Tax=Chitinophaga varians TaxID=2202339 RepID=UPI00165F2D49|nr:MBL fold metallo-hydrolase [Chitinophaga varians]MBC9912783.1 MBL fold metallo-hydrolase [Chitinophaga varians]